ncbi:MAG TPA: alpha/beta hydrolase [Trueperaceae bacterium]
MEGLHFPGIAAAAGTPLEQAQVAMVMVHGRGDSATGILQLASAFESKGVAYIAPEARHHTWYPNSFLAPIESNQPWLDSALEAIWAVVEEAATAVGTEKVVLLGFSQGACLASEFAARNSRRYGGVVALSGGLIGPDGTARDYRGSLEGTPAFFGCSDSDPHIPVARVHESAQVLENLGARVEKRIYQGMGHTVNQDEVDWILELSRGLLG